MATPSPPPKKILIASLNPVKIAATLTAFTTLFPSTPFLATGVSVPSGVPSQPLTSSSTRQGAYNRARNARASPGASEHDYFVGLEGGIEPFPLSDDGPQELESFAWIVVLDRDGKLGKARTAGYFLPEETARLVRDEGMELGEAEDLVWREEGTKRKGGSVGLLTGGVVTRESYYAQAVILALVPWRNGGLGFGRGV
ncbi:inosine triphosphate pyrophosphatase-like protein [Podospora conica]|nr:inosine triphosphate pyrophosphatase-like protein [Schizothecium conicum]